MAVLVGAQVKNACQVSGLDPLGKPILSVLFKEKFAIVDGRCTLGAEEAQLVEKPALHPDDEDLLAADTDLFPFKPLTDVVVKGHAYSYGRPGFTATVRVGAHSKVIQVHGDRRAELGPGGGARFSPAVPVERVPLSYSHAYGGADRYAAEQAFAIARQSSATVAELEFAQYFSGSPFRYARNPCGKGFVMGPDALAQAPLELPNLEDPAQPLREDSLFARHVLCWPRMPLPQATDWVSYAWFPRIAYMAVVPPFALDIPFSEVDRGLVPKDLLSVTKLTPEQSFRIACGASLGLQLPQLGGDLGGDAVVELHSLNARQERLTFKLPHVRPRLWTDGRQGRFNEASAVLHTIEIAPDEMSVTLLWRGSAPALRPYMDQELAKMPFKVELKV